MFEFNQIKEPTQKSSVFLTRSLNTQGLPYIAAAAELRRRGEISRNDPRSYLDPLRVRKYTEMSNSELISRYTNIVESRFKTSTEREDRVRYAAVMRASRSHDGLLRDGALFGLAQSTERQSLRLGFADKNDRHAREMLHISAALYDKAQRERVMMGFKTKDPKGNISKAAKEQGRSWIEVRDDLVKFNILSPSDPRRQIKPSDISFQRGGSVRAKSILPAISLEAKAMARLKNQPKDKQALGWLATAGALEGERKAKKVKGTLPPKKGVLKRATDLEL